VSAGLLDLILALGFGVIAVRRRTVAVALIAAQSLALGVGALTLASGRSGDYLVGSLVLLTKAAVLPVLLLVVLRRTRESGLIAAAAPGLVRLAGAAAAAFVAVTLVPPLGLGDARAEHVAVALVLLGITVVVARRPAFLQLLGLIVAENGVSLLAISVPGGLSYVVELGALFDLVLVVTVAAAFTHRIYAELGTGDTELLRGLHD
jgi:hydrogenase-4 membrane subunit HyfE